jgi:16S rRNA (adenine1518-N6/adenine1519-N6)-dimethyltransferase
MSLLGTTKLLLRRYRTFPKKLFGQNFMIEPSIFQCMVDYASLNQSDVVLDIGAGFGFFTRFLAANCKSVLAVESDAGLAKALRDQLKDSHNVKIIEGNVLKMQIPQFSKVVSIPPYTISSRLLMWLLSRNFNCAVLIFQKEFANRLVASIGSEDYGWLTVFAYYHVEVELLDAVSKKMFYPQPEVDSTVIRLKPRKLPPFKLKNKVFFKQMVKSLFTQRNKKVRNAILPFIKGRCAIVEEKIVQMVASIPFRDRRVRELAPEDFGALANALSN